MKSKITISRLARFLFVHWRRYPRIVTYVVVMMLVSVGFDLAFPIVAGRLVDTVSAASYPPSESDMRLVLIGLALFVGQSLGFQAARRLAMLGWGWLASHVMSDIVTEAFQRVQRFSTDWHSNSFAGATVRKITRGMWAYDSLGDTLYIGVFPTCCVLIGVSVSIALHWPLIGLFVAVGIALYVAVTAWLIRAVVSPRNRRHVAADSQVGGAIADAITCNAVVKSFGSEAREDARLRVSVSDWAIKALWSWWSMDFTMMMQALVMLTIQGGLIGLVLLAWSNGEATTGGVVYAMTSFMLMNGYLRDIGFHMQNLQRAANEIEDIVIYADQGIAEAEANDMPSLVLKGGEITLRNVSFAYPNGKGPIYRDFSAHIAPGERVALVGPSGSGKTTFVKLLQRLYEIDQGTIEIDGQDTRQVSAESLRRAIALVPQEPVLFHRSIGENIAYARPNATREQVMEAARLAHADLFIEKLAQGYDTLVGERGVKLSGGERQRVALARAFLADSPILILDEATSSLDSVTEAYIQDAIQRLMEGRTTLVIAHRFSTIRHMDRVLVFKEGRIVEEGSHEELMAAPDGLFRHLHAMQLAGVSDFLAEAG
ncbi:MAG: ATP-binding cassette domain-containing protein [Rhizobiales bacterium]|nr:ATP-binding cassette domain-containing protein [Hyphomicrobiales bacterium]